MKLSLWAWRTWPLLVWCAKNGQTLTYEDLSECLGYPLHGIGPVLEPIWRYCHDKNKKNKLPSLTAIVIQKGTREPGEGEGAKPEDVQSLQDEVFQYDWSQVKPKPEDLEG